MEELVHVLTIIDGTSEELLDLVVLRAFNLERFRLQFDVPDCDPQMLDKYAVGPDDVAFINGVIGQELPFEFERYGYFIEAAQR